MLNSNEIWVVELFDSDGCSGISVAKFLNVVVGLVDGTDLLVAGFCWDESELVVDSEAWWISQHHEAIPKIAGIPQLEWADFYFVRSIEESLAVQAARSFRESLTIVPATVQVADNSYIFLFSTSEILAKTASQQLPGSLISVRLLSELQVMY